MSRPTRISCEGLCEPPLHRVTIVPARGFVRNAERHVEKDVHIWKETRICWKETCMYGKRCICGKRRADMERDMHMFQRDLQMRRNNRTYALHRDKCLVICTKRCVRMEITLLKRLLKETCALERAARLALCQKRHTSYIYVERDLYTSHTKESCYAKREGRGYVKRDLRRTYIWKETFIRVLQKSPRKETYKRDLQKRPVRRIAQGAQSPRDR